MKRLNTLMIASCIGLAATPAMAGHPGNDVAWAKVLDARPVFETVRYPVNQEVCWDEQVVRRDRRAHSAAPVILGSILGGVIGHQFGGGNGKVALTAAGAALGGSIAADASQRRNSNGYYAVTERRCSMERDWRTEQQVVAWDVTYRFQGQVYQTRMRDEPGRRIQVRVQVDPLGY